MERQRRDFFRLFINERGAETAMGNSALVDYLRGDSSGEQRNGGSYRDRSVALGDIVNSDALFVGAQDFGYRMLDNSSEAIAYATYLTEKKARPTTIYVGANDGMLHAFDAASGVEQFAYVPNETIVNENLSSLRPPLIRINILSMVPPFLVMPILTPALAHLGKPFWRVPLEQAVKRYSP